MCRAQVDLKYNDLGDKGWCAIFDALRDNPQNKIAKWDLCNEGINTTIAKSLAGYAAVSASLTSVNLSDNTLCGVTRTGRGTYDATGINAIADALRVNASLKEVGTAALVCLWLRSSQLRVPCTGGPPQQRPRRQGLVRYLRRAARQPAEQDRQVGPR